MNLKNILMKIKNLFLKNLLILSLIFSPFIAVRAQDKICNDGPKEIDGQLIKLTGYINKVTEFTQPTQTNRAFVNFDPIHLKDSPGFHGMLFFGQGDTFYISHLPMFHKPHDYQAIIEVRLKPADKAKYQAAIKLKGGYFTFAPATNFVLPEVVTQKKPISGSLIQGHFERGGTPLISTDLELVRVVFYKKISPNDKKPPTEKYIIFGNGKEYFMTHEVFEKPNIDEIIPLPKDYPISKELKSDIKNNGLAFADLTIQDKMVVIKKDNEKIQFPYKEFYRETGDLK